MGQRHERPTLYVTGADRDGRAGGWRVSSQRPVVILQRVRLLPLGRARRTRSGRWWPEPRDARVFLLPRHDYAVDDNWHVMGLCATGSKDIVVDDAFVPEYRTHSYLDAFHLKYPGAAINDAPLYRLPFGLVFANGITAPAIGAALGALEAFREQSLNRVSVRDQSRVAEDPFTQYRLAEAAAAVARRATVCSAISSR